MKFDFLNHEAHVCAVDAFVAGEEGLSLNVGSGHKPVTALFLCAPLDGGWLRIPIIYFDGAFDDTNSFRCEGYSAFNARCDVFHCGG